MKILTFIAALVAVLLCFSSCTPANTPSETTDEITTDEITTDEITTEEDPPTTEVFSTIPNAGPETLKYFDVTLSHKPTEHDLLSLLLDKDLVDLMREDVREKEIPISEIVARLGKPHCYGLPVDIGPWFVWYTENGLYVAAHYFLPDDAPTPTDVEEPQRTIEYALVWKMWFCKQENSPQPIPLYLFEK